MFKFKKGRKIMGKINIISNLLSRNKHCFNILLKSLIYTSMYIHITAHTYRQFHS